MVAQWLGFLVWKVRSHKTCGTVKKTKKKKKEVVLNLNNRIYMVIPSVTTYIQTDITEKSKDEIKHNTK